MLLESICHLCKCLQALHAAHDQPQAAPQHMLQAPVCTVHCTLRRPFFESLCNCVQKASKERYIFFSFPHVAVDPNGGLGSIQRPGREACSSACGALKAALGHFQGTGVSGQAGGELHCCTLFYGRLVGLGCIGSGM